jgi:hypothetical protein
MNTLTAAEIAVDRDNFKILGSQRFVKAEEAEELRALLEIAEAAIRTNHKPPTGWQERTKVAIGHKVYCPEYPFGWPPS